MDNTEITALANGSGINLFEISAPDENGNVKAMVKMQFPLDLNVNMTTEQAQSSFDWLKNSYFKDLIRPLA